jgi:putative membrane protein
MRQKLSALLLLAGVALVTPWQVVAQQVPVPGTPQSPQWYWGPGPWHMGGDGYGWHFWWMGPMMMLFMLLLAAAVISLLFIRQPWSGGQHQGGPPWPMAERMWGSPTHSALGILNERFARGEIQKDEYEDKKATILSGGQH